MDDNNDAPGSTQAGRAPYERPAIEQSASFERLQVTCGHQATEGIPECEGDFSNS